MKNCKNCGAELPAVVKPPAEDIKIVEARKGRARWTLIGRVPGNHWFFREVLTERISIADESGDWPELTDDGVLYLDTNRRFCLRAMDGKLDLDMPVIKASSKKRSDLWARDPGIQALDLLVNKAKLRFLVEVDPSVLTLVRLFTVDHSEKLEHGTRPVFLSTGSGILTRQS